MVDDQSIQDALERIAGSRTFSGTPRLVQFLRFICEEKLAGRAHELKEIVIGSKVYRRPPDYSPREDATVRVEARRLRQKLEAYYGSEGGSDPVRIQLPVGTYVPEFVSTGLTQEPESAAESRPVSAVPMVPARRRWLIAAASVAAVLAAGWIVRSFPRGSTRFTIAVSPLESSSSDAEAVALARSFSSLAIRQLSAVEGFHVLSAGSSADAILAGSVQRAGARLRIVIDLTLSSDRSKLWSADYTCAPVLNKTCDAAASELAVRSLRVLLAGDRKYQQRKPLTRNSEALRLYLQGRELWNTQRASGLDASISAYEKAISLDPDFAEAYQGLAASELFLGSELPPSESKRANELLGRARQHCRKALSLDDKLADAHARLGNILLYNDWDIAGGELELQRALLLEPGRSEYVLWYSLAGLLNSHTNDVLQEMEFARLANPAAEETLTGLGFLYLDLGRREDARAMATEALRKAPRYGHAWVLQARLLEEDGDLVKAQQALQNCQVNAWARNLCLGEAGYLLARAGQTTEARRLIAQLENAPGAAPSCTALAHFALGDPSAALAALENAASRRDSFLFYVLPDSRLASLRAEPRFQAVRQRLRPNPRGTP